MSKRSRARHIATMRSGAEARTDYVLACRVCRTETGGSGQPDERWLREALRSSRR